MKTIKVVLFQTKYFLKKKQKKNLKEF